jgi:hypothetical protein
MCDTRKSMGQRGIHLGVPRFNKRLEVVQKIMVDEIPLRVVEEHV